MFSWNGLIQQESSENILGPNCWRLEGREDVRVITKEFSLDLLSEICLIYFSWFSSDHCFWIRQKRETIGKKLRNSQIYVFCLQTPSDPGPRASAALSNESGYNQIQLDLLSFLHLDNCKSNIWQCFFTRNNCTGIMNIVCTTTKRKSQVQCTTGTMYIVHCTKRGTVS